MSLKNFLSKNSKVPTANYETADLGLAVFLYTLKHRILEVKLLSPKKVAFCFEGDGNIDMQAALYLYGSAEAPARDLFNNYRALRAMTFRATGNLKK